MLKAHPGRWIGLRNPIIPGYPDYLIDLDDHSRKERVRGTREGAAEA